MVATLVLIIIKIFLFVVSNEISATLEQNYIDTKFLENSYVVFKSTASNIQFKNLVLIYLITFHLKKLY